MARRLLLRRAPSSRPIAEGAGPISVPPAGIGDARKAGMAARFRPALPDPATDTAGAQADRPANLATVRLLHERRMPRPPFTVASAGRPQLEWGPHRRPTPIARRSRYASQGPHLKTAHERSRAARRAFRSDGANSSVVQRTLPTCDAIGTRDLHLFAAGGVIPTHRLTDTSSPAPRRVSPSPRESDPQPTSPSPSPCPR